MTTTAMQGLRRALRFPPGIIPSGYPHFIRPKSITIQSTTIRSTIFTSASYRQANRSGESLEKQLFPSWPSNSAPLSSPEPSTSSLPPPSASKLPPRLGSTAGRSITVRGGDVAGAFLQLKRICTENSIARDAAAQRFYERPGLKKKRLKRERFRRRFKDSFKRMVTTVLEMKRQGI
ncbi:hypothetical protein H072_7453 [Dactylellina haptotyla CBS 200.50]|uniref:Ribosomal protein S21 n=1 Tax=Dactylellina haptotyla (strain CBS 200.50) TaxID=1284197 RepID=S8A731_DACHA|nr:hypothetical protein H072_7453 [Dactylellina haptotyla CBS 200.50]